MHAGMHANAARPFLSPYAAAQVVPARHPHDLFFFFF
jgi:hypothetical protein